MWLDFIAMMIGTLVLSALITRTARKRALLNNVLDVPNERSSHTVPMPRGGGIAIVLTATLTFGALVLFKVIPLDVFVALAGGGIAIAAVGFVDDHHHLSATARLAVHFGIALGTLLLLSGVSTLRVGEQVITFGWLGYLVGSLGIVWVINLFNFMDGIDGIAASEAVFIAWGAALLGWITGSFGAVPIAAFAFGAACCGFLLWNWPPAKIFMGDVGSGYLGYVIAVLALGAARESDIALFQWLILGGVFFVDATVTLLRRLIRGERVYVAHRSHAYQRLARSWGSHLRVTGVTWLVNVVWLLPCAWIAGTFPRYAWVVAIVALSPLVVLAICLGAGAKDQPVAADAV